MRRLMGRFVLAAAVLGLVVGKPGGTAQAGAIIDITQVGNEVVTTGSGSLNLTGLTFFANAVTNPLISPISAGVNLGPTLESAAEGFYGAMGPKSFGPGFGAAASSGTGDVFGVSGQANLPDGTPVIEILVPSGYVSGSPLSATDTYVNQSLGSLGLIAGTYTYTWSSDSLTVVVAPVPEPATIVHVGIGGLMGLAYYAWRRRRAKPRA